MNVAEAVPKPVFARHETFPLRHTWLKKAYNNMGDGSLFLNDDAMVRLGVGKNMVRSIRFWCKAFKIGKEPDSGKRIMERTHLGERILADDGMDPYLGRPETLWLLHWLVFAKPCMVPAWWVIMNEISATNIKRTELEDTVQSKIRGVSGWKAPSPSSVKKDINVFLQTYSARQNGKTDEYLDSPFRRLNIVRYDGATVRFVYGRKGIPPLLAAFACADFVNRVGIPRRDISVSRLVSEPGGIGNTFKLGEGDLADMLEEACGLTNAVSMRSINGSPHLAISEKWGGMLEQAYGEQAT